MTMIVCKCRNCSKEHSLYFDNETLCEDCFRKSVNTAASMYKKMESYEKSPMFQAKKFSYYCLFNLPLLTFFYLKVGPMGQLAYCIALIFGHFFYEFATWLARKF